MTFYIIFYNDYAHMFPIFDKNLDKSTSSQRPATEVSL